MMWRNRRKRGSRIAANCSSRTSKLSLVVAGWLAVGVICSNRGPVFAAELTIADFNGTGMNWTWDDFAWTAGSTSVRIYDPLNSTGGAGKSTPGLNLSSYADGRFVIDMTPNVGNGSNYFGLSLEDTSGNRGFWNLNVSSLEPGVPATLVSQTTLANPGSGANVDLSHVNFFQIDGEYGNPNPFDMSFDNIAVSTTVEAPPAYPGQEPDAPWRAEAAARIDAIRKADFHVSVTDALGNPVPNATVGVHMQKHEFGFGSAVQAVRLRDDDPQYDMYKEKVAELFNIATVENNLKWPAWDGQWGSNFTQQGAEDAIDWLTSQGIAVRGHNVIWPGYNNLPNSVQTLLNNAPLDASEQQQLRDLIANHIADVVGTLDGKLASWDVINEPYDNHDVMDNLDEGNQAMVDWFQQVRAHDANAKLYLNDYGILSSGGATDTAKQQFEYDTLQYLKDNGAPIDGLGLQGHFNADSLTGPEQLWEILDRYEALGLDMQVTEFDIDTDDEQLQADYTRDFLTAMFAHEGIDAVLSWGFWEGTAGDRAMFNNDWSIKPNGQAFLDLVFGQWWTDEDVDADALGEALIRAFKGDHDVSASFGEFSDMVLATLTDGGLQLQFTLPFLLGDYNRDGTVDAADYTEWRDTLGDEVEKGTGADGNGNGVIDEGDFLVWRQYFGNTLPQGAGAAAAVPEPASICLWGLAAMGFWWACPQRVSSR
jgi:endo-1,4-beta-xylanase